MKQEKINFLSFLANALIAIIAVGGFIYSIYSNKETSETLEVVTTTFETYSDPFLQFDDYDYLKAIERMDCEHPPIGINYRYRNISNFPIRLKITSRRLLFDGRDFLKGPTHFDFSKEEMIIAPNDVIGFTVQKGQEFKSIFKNKRGILTPPFIEFHLNGIISNLSLTKKYEINLIDYIGVDCEQFGIKSVTHHHATYEKIK